MTGFRKLLNSAAAYTIANVLNGAIPLFLLPVLTRVLTPTEYGTVTMFATVMSVLSAFTGLSIHGAVSVRYFDKETNHPRFVGTSLAILGGSTFLALLVVWLVATPLAQWTKVPEGWLLLAVLASAAQFIIHVRLVLWQVQNEVVQYGLFQTAQTLLNLSLSLGLILILGMGWEGRAFGIVTAVFLFSILALYSLHRKGLVRWQLDVGYAKASLRFGIPLIPHTIGGMMLTMSDRFIVASMLGMKEMGVYAAAMQVGMIIGVLADACNKAFAPWLFESLSRKDSNRNAKIIRYTYALFLVIPFLAVIFGGAAPMLLGIIVGEQYRTEVDVVLYIALGGAFSGMYLLVTNYIFFSGGTERLALVTVLSGAANVLLSWWLVGLYGAVGAAYAYMLAQAFCFFLTWALAVKSYPMPWSFKACGVFSFVRLWR